MVVTPEICSGCLRIEGTRITVLQIATHFLRGLGAEEIADQYPHLTLGQVYAALAYFHADRKEVEAELQAEAGEAERLEAPTPGWSAATTPPSSPSPTSKGA